jgi:2',3'-cyclic-nucleotide 2'-phosphodiesterase (5'-nucleotidase family)
MKRLALFLSLFLFQVACKRGYLPQISRSQAQYTKIDSPILASPEIQAQIQPYAEQLAQEMNQVVGQAVERLVKVQPEGGLGNWMADAVLAQAQIKAEEQGIQLDFCVLNHGGMRVPSIEAGPITKGKIFELAPFDNYVIIVELEAKDLPELFAHIIQKGGWPLSQQVQIQASKTEGLLSWQLQGGDKNKDKYYIATNDYLANGGDDCKVLVGKKQIATPWLIRDALLLQLQKNPQARGGQLGLRFSWVD